MKPLLAARWRWLYRWTVASHFPAFLMGFGLCALLVLTFSCAAPTTDDDTRLDASAGPQRVAPPEVVNLDAYPTTTVARPKPRVSRGTPRTTVARPRVPAGGDVRRVSSTAYCLRGRMASGKPTYSGAAAMNGVPLGSRWHVVELGRTFIVEDRIGHGSQFDIWFASCEAAIQYGRRTVTIRRVG